jgi:hypothetical protein
MFKTMDRQTARKYTRGAQLAAGVLAASAVGVAAWGMRTASELPGALIPAAGGTQPAATAAAPEQETPVDVAALALRLEGPAPVAPPPPPPAKPDSDVITHVDPLPAPAGPDVKYLGSIVEPNRRVALLVVGGHQKLVPEGRAVQGDWKLAGVEDGAITLNNGSGDHRIELASRTGPLTSERQPGVNRGMPMNMNPALNNAKQLLMKQQREMGGMPQPGIVQPGVQPQPGMLDKNASREAQELRDRYMREQQMRDKMMKQPGGKGGPGEKGGEFH